MNSPIVIATNNLHKVVEIKSLLGNQFNLLTLDEIGFDDDIEETGITFEENALIKARAIHEKFQINCFADDSGLEIEALNFEPGVFSARYSGEPVDHARNIQKVLKNLEGISNRKARFRTCIALILDGKEYLFNGIINGTIRLECSGNNGFGYDPIFEPEGYSNTFAEMNLEMKSKISHRGKAIAQLVEFLNQQ